MIVLGLLLILELVSQLIHDVTALDIELSLLVRLLSVALVLLRLLLLVLIHVLGLGNIRLPILLVLLVLFEHLIFHVYHALIYIPLVLIVLAGPLRLQILVLLRIRVLRVDLLLVLTGL